MILCSDKNATKNNTGYLTIAGRNTRYIYSYMMSIHLTPRDWIDDFHLYQKEKKA